MEIPATITGYAWYSIGDYGKSEGDLWLFDDNYPGPMTYRPFLKFNLDTLPESLSVLSADLNYYHFTSGLAMTVIKLIPDPGSLGAQELLSRIASAPALCPPESSIEGWQSRSFSTRWLPALDSCRAAHWVSIAIDKSQGWGCWSYGRDGEYPPYLRIEYTQVGVHEPQSTNPLPPQLDLTPNPATGGCVAVRCNIATGTVGKLTLRDVLGRTVKSLVLDPSGITRLDLRGLAPGVYMATLDGTMPLVSRKLVITAR